MSGSPPAEDTFEPPQLAGTRRKRSYTPPTTTASGRQQPPTQTTREEELTPNRREPTAVTAGGVAVAPYPSSFHTGHQYGYEPGPLAIGGARSSFPPQLGPRELSPKATRKTKAHVASACVNCKKKHLRCDNARPCRRCIQSGKESSCIDVEHKKRGRPPLKAEDGRSRTFESSINQPQGPPGSFSRLSGSDTMYAQQRMQDPRPTSSNIAGRPSLYPRPPSYQSIYAPPTVSPSPATAMGTMIRPYTSASPAPASYQMAPNVGMGGYSQQQMAPRFAGGYGYVQDQQQPSQGSSDFRLFPPTPAQPQQLLQAPSQVGYGQYPGMPSDLQLPPIRPAPPGGMIDPAMAQRQTQQQQLQQQQQQQQQAQQQPGRSDARGGNGSTQQPDPKRPKISDILRHD